MNNMNTMIDRTGMILDYLYHATEAIGVSKMATDLEMPKATVFRILVTLEKWDIVKKEYHTDNYKLGMTLIKYGAKVSSNLSLVEIARPIVNDLSQNLGESVNLNIEHQNFSLNIYKTSTGNSGLISGLIPISSLNCSASGKIFLSKRSDEAIKSYFGSTDCEKRTINSVVTFEDYKKEVANLNEQGMIYDDEEYEYGLFCTAMPILHKGTIVATLSVTGPKTRLELKGFDIIEEELNSAVHAISNLIEFLEPESLYNH